MHKVMLIDDEEIIVAGLKLLVDWNALGFSIVGQAPNGEEALKLTKELKPDLIITDIKMPRMSGLELSAAIKSSLPDTKIILLSGYDDFEYAQHAIELGCFSYLLKPVSKEDLSKKLMEVKQLLEEEKSKNSFIEIFSLNRKNMKISPG